LKQPTLVKIALRLDKSADPIKDTKTVSHQTYVTSNGQYILEVYDKQNKSIRYEIFMNKKDFNSRAQQSDMVNFTLVSSDGLTQKDSKDKKLGDNRFTTHEVFKEEGFVAHQTRTINGYLVGRMQIEWLDRPASPNRT
jgi:hypothetical protein